MSNTTLLNKADWALSDLSSGGLLSPAQSNAFIRKLLIQPTVLRSARRIVMPSHQTKVNKIQFADRILKAGVQSGSKVTLDNTTHKERSKPTTTQITLNSQEVIAEVRLPYEVIEDNIEQGLIGAMTDTNGVPASGGITDTIMSMIAERAALDLEELALLGDTNSNDPFLKLTNGYLTTFSTNVVDVSGAPISRTALKNGMKTLPAQYRRNRSQMAHYVSTENEIEYRDTLASRETTLGDAQLQSVAPVYAAGAPVSGVGLMPSSTGFLTHPMNLLFGIQRQLNIESDKDIAAREYIIVLTARVDFQVEEESAGVKYINFDA